MTAACGQRTLAKVVRTDGSAIVGELIDVRPEAVVVKAVDGTTITVPRASIAALETARSAELASTLGSRASTSNSTTAGSATPSDPTSSRKPGSKSGRETRAAAGSPSKIVLASGTVLEITLNSTIGSDTSYVGESVDSVLLTPASLGSVPANVCHVIGAIADVKRPEEANGRGRLAVRFNTLRVLKGTAVPIVATMEWEAPARREPPARVPLWRRLMARTKRGLGFDQDSHGVNVHVAAGTVLRVRLEQAATIPAQAQ